MRVARICIAAAAIATASSMLVVAPARANGSTPDPSTTVLTTAVAAPFNLDIGRRGLLVADGGLNQIGRVARGGAVVPVVTGATGTSGVATSRDGRYLAYTTTEGGEEGITASGVTIVGPGGRTVMADTLAYERRRNPDSGVHYGVDNPSQCVSDALTAAHFPVSYTGLVDSHAYSLAAYRDGFVLADAGANALLWVGRSGHVSTLAVLPAQPSTITAEQAAALQLDPCVAGTTYAFESVPTDVEVGRDGYLYVTVLPGGPEGPVLGARGKVYRVNPRTGKSTVVASGLAGATNLAIVGGRLYVAELFAGRVSVVRHGRVSAFLDLPGAVAVEAGRGGRLYAATLGDEQSNTPGSVVRIDTRKGWRH